LLWWAISIYLFKKIAWQDHVPNKTGIISEDLNSMAADRKAFSMGQLIDEDPDESDLTNTYGPIQGWVAIDCTKRFSDWKIGVTSKIAIKKTDPCRLFDGLIDY